MNGATPDGRRHPTVHRLSLALARAACASSSPTLPASPGESCRRRRSRRPSPFRTPHRDRPRPQTSESRSSAYRSAERSRSSQQPTRSFSNGSRSSRVSHRSAISPKVMRLATTGTYRDGDGCNTMRRRRTSSWVLHARSRRRSPSPTATADLCSELRALDHESSTPVELPARAFRRAGAEAERLYDLLANTDPHRFDSLYAALPAHVRAAAVSLSPIHVAPRLHAPVEIATAPQDKYFPVDRSAGACRGLTACANHRHIAAGARNTALRRAKRRRAAQALRVLHPLVQGCNVLASATLDGGADVKRSEWRSSPDATVSISRLRQCGKRRGSKVWHGQTDRAVP